MRVLESGGTVEQHKAAVAALKFGTAVGSAVGGSDPCDVSGSFLSHRGLGPASGPGSVGGVGGVVGGLPVSVSNNPAGSGPAAGGNSTPGGNLKKGFSKYPPSAEDMAASMYGKGPAGALDSVEVRVAQGRRKQVTLFRCYTFDDRCFRDE